MQNHISRRALAAGLALAPVAGLASAEAPTKIAHLIDAHRSARQAFERVIDDLEEIQDAYDAAHGDGFEVPSFIGGGCGSRNGLDRCREWIAGGYKHQRANLKCLAQVAPELAEQARKVFDAKEVENMALIDKAFEEEEARKEAFGLAEVQRRWEATNEAECAAALALCSYRCKTMEEARIRAEYIAQTPIIREDGEGEYIEALLRSFIPDGAGDCMEV